jgi:hypothetical protein
MPVSMSVAIITISTIIAASIFAGAAISQLYQFQNVFKEVSQSNQEVLSSSIRIIGESNNFSYIVIWVKNTGRTVFRLDGGTVNATYWDVFLTFPSGTFKRFPYTPGGSSECWNAQILNDKGSIGVWEKGETLQIKVYTATISSGSYTVRITLPNGVGDEDVFSIG